MIKVFGGNKHIAGKQHRVIIAARSKKRAAELFKVSMYEFNNYYCETRNQVELAVAKGSPETVFYTELNYKIKTIEDYKIL